MKFSRLSAAFTLIELLVVIAIIGILTAMVAPSLSSFRKGDAMAAGTSQLLGAVSQARQLAISQHTDVYMVFLDTNWVEQINWPQVPVNSAERNAITNLADKQLNSYAFVSFRSVGDQPGKQTFRYLSDWKTLPEGVFIPEAKFLKRMPVPNYTINDLTDGRTFNIFGFSECNVPFPKENSRQVSSLPCIAFDYQGRLISQPLNQDAEFIPLAHGSILSPRDPQTKNPRLGPASVEERPPGNSTNAYNLVRIDRLTGRGFLERKEMR